MGFLPRVSPFTATIVSNYYMDIATPKCLHGVSSASHVKNRTDCAECTVRWHGLEMYLSSSRTLISYWADLLLYLVVENAQGFRDFLHALQHFRKCGSCPDFSFGDCFFFC